VPPFSYELAPGLVFGCSAPPAPPPPASSPSARSAEADAASGGAAVSAPALALARHVAASQPLLLRRTVLDLCGAPGGLAGLAALRHADRVVACGAGRAELAALEDAAEWSACAVVIERLRIVELAADGGAAAAAGPEGDAARAAGRAPRGFDVVLVSRLPPGREGAVLEAAAGLLAPGGCVLVAHELSRRTAERVAAAAEACGLEQSADGSSVASAAFEPRGVLQHVSILCLRRRE
jgi:SAM-dependent methyltransferase